MMISLWICLASLIFSVARTDPVNHLLPNHKAHGHAMKRADTVKAHGHAMKRAGVAKYKLIGVGKSCTRETTYTYKLPQCNGWPAVTEAECQTKCTTNEMPVGCAEVKECKYALWNLHGSTTQKRWKMYGKGSKRQITPTGWCHLADEKCQRTDSVKKTWQLREKIAAKQPPESIPPKGDDGSVSADPIVSADPTVLPKITIAAKVSADPTYPPKITIAAKVSSAPTNPAATGKATQVKVAAIKTTTSPIIVDTTEALTKPPLTKPALTKPPLTKPALTKPAKVLTTPASFTPVDKVTTPGQKVTTPGQKVTTPGQKVSKTTERFTTVPPITGPTDTTIPGDLDTTPRPDTTIPGDLDTTPRPDPTTPGDLDTTPRPDTTVPTDTDDTTPKPDECNNPCPCNPCPAKTEDCNKPCPTQPTNLADCNNPCGGGKPGEQPEPEPCWPQPAPPGVNKPKPCEPVPTSKPDTHSTPAPECNPCGTQPTGCNPCGTDETECDKTETDKEETDTKPTGATTTIDHQLPNQKQKRCNVCAGTTGCPHCGGGTAGCPEQNPTTKPTEKVNVNHMLPNQDGGRTGQRKKHHLGKVSEGGKRRHHLSKKHH